MTYKNKQRWRYFIGSPSKKRSMRVLKATAREAAGHILSLFFGPLVHNKFSLAADILTP